MLKRWIPLLLSSSFLFAEDAAETPTKKELIKAIPHIWLSADLLYMKAKENRQNFANGSAPLSSSDFTQGALIRPTYEWNPGLRLDLGYQGRDWMFFANWTYLNNYAHGEKNTTASNGFFPVLSHDSDLLALDSVTSASFQWRLKQQLFDLGASYPWKAASHWIIKPHLSLRTAFIDQSYDVHYAGGYFAEGMDRLQMRNSFFGMGPALGITPCILFGKGFSFIADLSTSALMGRFFVKQREQYLSKTRYYYSDFLTRLCWTLDAKAAFAWQKEILYRALVVSLQAGWEWHKYYDQNLLPQNRFHLLQGKRNIILEGGFFSLMVGF